MPSAAFVNTVPARANDCVSFGESGSPQSRSSVKVSIVPESTTSPVSVAVPFSSIIDVVLTLANSGSTFLTVTIGLLRPALSDWISTSVSARVNT